jgi:hypothetical protein
MDTIYGWQELYRSAVLETDWSKIEQKIQEADNGIRARLHEFSLNHGGTPEENQAITDALNGLSVLRKDVAVWHGSNLT